MHSFVNVCRIWKACSYFLTCPSWVKYKVSITLSVWITPKLGWDTNCLSDCNVRFLTYFILCILPGLTLLWYHGVYVTPVLFDSSLSSIPCGSCPCMIKDKLDVCMQRRNYSIATYNFLTIVNENAIICIIVLLLYF
jgi:hypothetical protein